MNIYGLVCISNLLPPANLRLALATKYFQCFSSLAPATVPIWIILFSDRSKPSYQSFQLSFHYLHSLVPPPHLAAALGGDVDEENHGRGIVDDLSELYLSGKLDATILGHLCWRLSKLKVAEAEPFAVPPKTSNDREQQTGKYQRKMDTAFDFGLVDRELYPLETPMRDSITGEREKGTVWIQPIQEALEREIEQNPGLLREWADKIQNPWIPAYEQHRVVRTASMMERPYILPVALYMDASRFQTRDALLVMTVHLLCSSTRHLVFGIPKTCICDCGCGGWCTLYPIYNAIAYCLESAMTGQKPFKRHDGTPLDAVRALVAGKRARRRFIVIDIDGDWSEIPHRWALPSWQATLGCFICRATQRELRDPDHVIVTNSIEDYFRECSICERWILVDTLAIRTAIRWTLIDDSTRKGRVLKDNVANILKTKGLKKGDRLEPSPQLQDVWDFEKMEIPFLVCFWRIPPPEELTVHHRHPLISQQLGTSIWSFGIDTLHGLHLGAFPAWSTRGLHLLFEADVFLTRASRFGDHMKANALITMGKLKAWYPEYERGLTPEVRRGMTRIQSITPAQLGVSDSGSNGFVDFKASENRHFLPFVLHLVRMYRAELETHHRDLDWNALDASGQALEDMMQIMGREGRHMSDAGVDALILAADRHMHYAKACGVHMLPKHHMVASILFRSRIA